MNRFLTVLLGLLTTGAGCFLGTLAISSLVGISDQRLPLVPLVLVLAVSFAMLWLGLITLMSYAYESSFDKNGIEMQFVFRKEQVSWESIQCYRNIFFRNTFSGANVWVMLKYKLPKERGAHFRRAVLLVAGTGPTVGTATRDFKTPLDLFLSSKKNEVT